MESQRNKAYLLAHQRDQDRFERITQFANDSAAVIASMLGRSLVKTEVGQTFE